MGLLCKTSLAALFATFLVSPVVAQNAPPPSAISAASPRTLTGKERLGRKWMDEQRIDNCNVPIDKRGVRPRPSACRLVPTG